MNNMNIKTQQISNPLFLRGINKATELESMGGETITSEEAGNIVNELSFSLGMQGLGKKEIIKSLQNYAQNVFEHSNTSQGAKAGLANFIEFSHNFASIKSGLKDFVINAKGQNDRSVEALHELSRDLHQLEVLKPEQSEKLISKMQDRSVEIKATLEHMLERHVANFESSSNFENTSEAKLGVFSVYQESFATAIRGLDTLIKSLAELNVETLGSSKTNIYALIDASILLFRESSKQILEHSLPKSGQAKVPLHASSFEI